MKEPSILDYLKSRLNPWQKEKIEIPRETPGPENQNQGGVGDVVQVSTQGEDGVREITIKLRLPVNVPWRTFLALVLALIAQRTLEPPVDSIPMAVGLYVFAVFFLGWATFINEFALPALPESETQTDPQFFHRNLLISSIFLALAAFILFTNNLFNWLNVSLWLASLALFTRGLWLSDPEKPAFIQKLVDFFK
ncbi:MAG: hypothetical protein NT121_14915, partial [Chloroflexi bacterium]|nr:hypothetical protein [Chloroflexota bacterium]